MPWYGVGKQYAARHMGDAELVFPVVQNTWYDVVPATDNCRVYHWVVGMADNNETLELQVVIDGFTYAGAFNAVANTFYTVIKVGSSSLLTLTGYNPGQGVFNYSSFEGHNVRLRVRKTTNVGAGNLYSYSPYAVMEG